MTRQGYLQQRVPAVGSLMHPPKYSSGVAVFQPQLFQPQVLPSGSGPGVALQTRIGRSAGHAIPPLSWAQQLVEVPPYWSASSVQQSKDGEGRGPCLATHSAALQT